MSRLPFAFFRRRALQPPRLPLPDGLRVYAIGDIHGRLDCLLMNVDRTPQNTNMLSWHKELWLIDHGASLYFHHSWNNWQEYTKKPFVQVKDHVLLPKASNLEKAGEHFPKVLFEPTVA